MLTRLGTPRPAEDVVDLLLECHGRIRSFTDLARRLAAADRPPPQEVADAAASVRRYFEEALPLHVADEEESLLPRIAGRDREVDRALVTMHREHAEHEVPLARLVALCRALEARPERHAEIAAELGAVGRELADAFGRHLAEEEATILPAIRRIVPEAERRAMADELRARRSHSSR